MSSATEFYRQLSPLTSSVPLAQLKDALSLLRKILGNILGNPNEEKFRTIRSSNPTLASRLFISPNVGQALRAIGFAEASGEFHLPSSQPLAALESALVCIEGLELEAETEENNRGLDPEVARKAMLEEQRMLAKREAELAKISGQVHCDRKEVQLDAQNRPIQTSKGKTLKFGAQEKTMNDWAPEEKPANR